MIGRVVFLLEEYSMKALLDGLLPRLYPELIFLCVPHDGKGDLERSLPRKLRGWREPGVRFVVVRDNDRGDCADLKKHLRGLCADRPGEDCLIRIACQELEAWYLGDPDALAEAFGKESLRQIGSKARFREPDRFPIPQERSPDWSRSTRKSVVRASSPTTSTAGATDRRAFTP